MPANLTAQYHEAEARFRSATDHQEKVAALEEMLSVIPKHKGTEKMQADIRRRLSKLKSEAKRKGKASARHADPFAVRREGAGQLVLLGPPNSGKSSLVERLTRASPEIALYPFTTHKPLPAMMKFEDVPIQLVDTPPVTLEYFESGMTSLLRLSNGIVVVADLGAEDPVGPIEDVIVQLEKHHLKLAPPNSSDEPDAKPAIWLANKYDTEVAEENMELLQEFIPRPWIHSSARNGSGTDLFAKRAFEVLGVLRIYTKPPGKKPDFGDPTILKRGATVLDAVTAVHREFVDRLRFVRLWRSEGPGVDKALPGGIKVERDFVLLDKDVVEIHVERSL
jgi:ribosome-interacting GTPase 1